MAYQSRMVRIMESGQTVPVIQINDDYYTDLTPGELEKILDELAGS